MPPLSQRIQELTGSVVNATQPLAERIRGITDYLGGVTRVEKERPVYEVKNRGVKFNNDDLDTLKHVLYSEISNREPEKQKMESRVIINTALNRMPEYKKKGKDLTLSEVLRMPNQYQGFQPNDPKSQFRISKEGKGNAKKTAVIDEVLSELTSGQFEDSANGAVYYIHNPDGSITFDDKKPLYE